MNFKQMLNQINIQKMETINLQSDSQLELLNLIKDKKIDISKLQLIDLYASTFGYDKIKNNVPSKKWLHVTLYDDITSGCTTPGHPCFEEKFIAYFDYTTNTNYIYFIGLQIEYDVCKENPIQNISCLNTIRIDLLNNFSIDFLIPSNILQEAVNLLPIQSNNNIKYILLTLSIGLGLYLISKSKK